jgi:hypothetical protein
MQKRFCDRCNCELTSLKFYQLEINKMDELDNMLGRYNENKYVLFDLCKTCVDDTVTFLNQPIKG